MVIFYSYVSLPECMRSVVQDQYHGEDVIGIPQTSVTRLNRKRDRKRNGFHWLPFIKAPRKARLCIHLICELWDPI